jgi:hypothetical protein
MLGMRAMRQQTLGLVVIGILLLILVLVRGHMDWSWR